MSKTNETNSSAGNEKLVFVSSLIIFVYFACLILINFLKLDWVILGVFRELLTIPFLLALIVLFPFSAVLFFKTKRKIGSMPFLTLLSLLATVLLLILSS